MVELFFLEAVMNQARAFSCLVHLRPLMPHPENSSLFRCFLVWRLPNYICPAGYIQDAVIQKARAFSCLVYLRPLMPHPENSNLFRCFPVWRVAITSAGGYTRGHYTKGKGFFLLVIFTASYAASGKQQSVPLFSGVASGKLLPLASGKLYLPVMIPEAVANRSIFTMQFECA